MTVQEFFDYFNGIYCDYDGAYGDQCFDLANGYSRWIGGPRFTGATADLIINQAGTFYTRIDNAADNFPIKGDIIVWKWPHVGVATGNNTDSNKFEALEQNDPTNSDCHIKEYLNYDGVLGWLRPNTLPQEVDQSIIDDLRTARDKNWNGLQAEIAVNTDLKNQLQDLQLQIQKLREANDAITKADADTGGQLLDAQHKVTDYKNFLDQVSGALKLPTPSDYTPVDVDHMISAINTLQAPVDAQVKPLQDHALDLVKQMPSLEKKNTSKKDQTLIQKVTDFLSNIFH